MDKPLNQVITFNKASKLEDHFVNKPRAPLTEEQLTYLKGHYNLTKRNKLAKKLGIKKYDLNMIMIALGLGG